MLWLTSCKTPSAGISGNNSDAAFYKKYSKKLGVTLTGTEDKEFIRYVSDWLGTPYKYGGCTRAGTDCSGFTMAVYRDVYKKDLYRSSADQMKNVVIIDKDKLAAADLIFFKISGDKVSHVGMYISGNKFVHASTKRGVVVNNLTDAYYTKYFYAAGKVIRKK